LGITLTIIGTGFFKPNILQWLELYKVGTVVEMLVLDCFMGINIGALLGGAVCVY
jgi:POT family proton-dependent oligopeptide transporter